MSNSFLLLYEGNLGGQLLADYLNYRQSAVALLQAYIVFYQ